jgi:hypothetical protein
LPTFEIGRINPMMRRAATSALSTIALLGCSPARSAQAEESHPPLDELIAFDDPYECVASKDFAALTSIVEFEEFGETYRPILASPRIPAGYQMQVGAPDLSVRPTEYRATLPLRGSWQGLPLRSLVVIGWIESESGFYLVFESTRDEVLEAANRAGFAVPASGADYRLDEDAVLGVNVGVEDYEGGGALYCIDG